MDVASLILVTSDCLSISHLKTLPQQKKQVACLVRGNLEKAQSVMKANEVEYDILYQEKPKDVIYVAVPVTFSSKNNYAEVHSWILKQSSTGLIQKDNPGPYQFL